MKKALISRELTKETPVILVCCSGARGVASAKFLEGKDYKAVYIVIDGFEGGKIKEGEKKNFRLKNGWKVSSLPWSYKLNKEKMSFRKD